MRNLKIKEAIDLLAKGEVVAIPTETVYGLAADARSDKAVSKIFEAKGRPADNPLIVHVGNRAQVRRLTTNVSKNARLLMKHFWPGPLTIILESSGVVSKLVTAGLPTVGIRMPNHKVALELLRTSGLPLAAPSANISGKPSPTSIDHVIHDMGNRIAGVVEGGICEIGIESTVIDMTLDVPVILRPGSISRQQIEAVIGPVHLSSSEIQRPKAPGMKYAHYAPKAEVFIIKGSLKFFKSTIQAYKKKNSLKVGVLCHMSSTSLYQKADVVKGIGNKGKNLYAALREFDEQQVDVILSEYFDDEAVMNRLLKASEERVLSEVED